MLRTSVLTPSADRSSKVNGAISSVLSGYFAPSTIPVWLIWLIKPSTKPMVACVDFPVKCFVELLIKTG
ncbi:hypothetical protein [Microcoleus sp. CAWBG24]|uniref:hypothetical protein n=1 Tax=Microcoleus sp. CAWBG24 TaxID=2841644 RepID=UPI0025DD46B9|nr:hypothetical protein [Microcoleus sp. CAWBG24]